MKKILPVLSIVFLFFFAAAEKSPACSCVMSQAPLKTQVKAAFDDAAAVFSGEVVEIVPKNEYEVTVRIRVEKSWKGNQTGEIAVTTGKDSALCGYNFETGGRYLVYAYGTAGALATNNCSRTTAANAPADIRYLNKLKRKTKKT
ncbi:MAG: hypothetical protein JSS81_04670 [Acidobacteria bacterium]|nr:hypothetical protein [Acidobacteriota bacterium]